MRHLHTEPFSLPHPPPCASIRARREGRRIILGIDAPEDVKVLREEVPNDGRPPRGFRMNRDVVFNDEPTDIIDPDQIPARLEGE